MMADKRNTGFYPQDADWTRGRAQYVADAEAIVRKQMGLARKVTLETNEKENQYDRN